MKLNNEVLDIKFKEYYKSEGQTATHVFVYSAKQDSIILFDERKPITKIDGVTYSEMRSRDSELNFFHDDVVFVGVGDNSKITLHDR